MFYKKSQIDSLLQIGSSIYNSRFFSNFASQFEPNIDHGVACTENRNLDDTLSAINGC